MRIALDVPAAIRAGRRRRLALGCGDEVVEEAVELADPAPRGRLARRRRHEPEAGGRRSARAERACSSSRRLARDVEPAALGPGRVVVEDGDLVGRDDDHVVAPSLPARSAGAPRRTSTASTPGSAATAATTAER